MEPQQMQALLALESSLHVALEAAQATQQDSLARMEDSRRLVAQLFENEAAETALYVEDTRLEMRAVRDVLQLEMDKARREVESALDEAKRDAKRAKAERDAQRQLLREKARQLQARERQRQIERDQEIASIKRAAATEAAQIVREMNQIEASSTGMNEPSVSGLPVASAQQQVLGVGRAEPPLRSALVEPLWVLPFLVSLLMCSCLWLAYSTYRERHTITERRKRVLYSEQLKNHFANGTTESLSPMAKSVEESPVTPVSDRQPTLRRRLRPGWSPAASTASTVSPPDTPSIFTTHASFETSTPSPFGS